MRGRVISLYGYAHWFAFSGAMGSGALAEWLGGVEGAPHAVLFGAIILGIIFVSFVGLA